MSLRDFLGEVKRYAVENPGKFWGTSVGLLVGTSLVTLGFWRTLTLALMTAAGYAIGKWTDEEGKGIKEFLEEKLPGRPYLH